MTDTGYKKIKQILWTIFIANVFVAAVKIAMGAAIGSAAMTADGFHSLSDGSSNIIGLIGIRLASKPKDEDHPYGHRKFETLSSMLIGGILAFIGIRTVVSAIGRLADPMIPDITIESLILLLLTLFSNIFVSIYEYRKGTQLKSAVLISDSLHTRSDIYISVGVLTALAAVKAGLPSVIDPIVSLVVAGFIFHAAYEIIRDNMGVLVDKAAMDAEKIREIAMSFSQVKDIHNIRSRGCYNETYIDMHIMTKPEMSVEESHELIHSIEDEINAHMSGNVQVIVHLEPFNDTHKTG